MYYYRCIICNKPVPDYEPKYCCDGRECGCLGKPTEPCLCSKECDEALFHCPKECITMDERRKIHNIKWID